MTAREEADHDPSGVASRIGSVADSGASPHPSPPVDVEEERLFASVLGRLFGRGDPVTIGRHRIERLLGAGAMGAVYLGRDPDLDRPVAIKLVHAHLSGERWAARLRREAKALARLAHPNVVHVYEVGEHAGQVFLAMEYVRGRSLRAWIAETRPPWQEVLAAYVAAGRGLSAAHGVGLTHRDFKPDNVLRGDDGRIRVADFGLASLDGEVEARETSWSAGTSTDPELPLLGPVLSLTGELKGTPAYMPPEQFRGLPLDGRADQFAFCVALYEGLWGERPFAEGSLRARMIAPLLAPAAPGDRKRVPDWVWPVIQRGLRHETSERWPSMDALLDALESLPRRRRRRRRQVGLGLVLGATASAAWVIGAAGWSGSVPTQRVCEDLGDGLTGVWDDARRDQVRQALLATGRPQADDTWRFVERDLDAWSSRSIAEQAASCRATRIEGTQSEAMLDRRTACLHRRRREVNAVIDVLASADPDVLGHASRAMAELPELGSCSAAALEARPVPAVDPARRGEVEAGYEALAHARAQLAVGRPDRAATLADRALAQGETTGHAPLTFEARAMQATITIESGKLEPGLEALREVVLLAERAELLELAADLRVQLARAAAGDFAEPRLERWLLDEAQLAIDRMDRPDDPRQVVLLTARARISEQAGDFPAAIAAHERAFELADGRLEEGPRAMLRVGIGTAMYRNGDYAGARAELLDALEVVRAAWGRASPEAARIEFDLGMIATDLGELDRARQHLDSAIAIDEGVWGKGSIEVARDRFALAYLAFGTGEIDRGCEAIADVLEVYEAELGAEHDETASAMNASALCRYHADDFEGAIAGYRRALAVQQRILGEQHHEVGLVHANIGEAELALGRLDESLASYERAYEILAAALPGDHPELAFALRGRALVRLETGQAARALPDLERALALADASQALELAEIRFGLARALVAVNGARDRDRATALAGQALEGFESARAERQARAARAWLERLAD